MKLEKLINNNVRSNLIGVNITEYDLKAAHPTVLALLYPNDPEMTSLRTLPKDQYKYKIGNMIKAKPALRKEIDAKILELFNEFLLKNHIAQDNFLASTPDSLLIVDQLASVTKFENIAQFRCKEGISYSSLFYYASWKYILFDRISRRIRIKGVGSEEETKNYQFVKTILRHLCVVLDNSNNIEHMELLRELKNIRNEYMNSKDIDIYRDITHKNQFKYIVDGKEVYSDIPLKEDDGCILIKSDNYLNFIFPLMRSFI